MHIRWGRFGARLLAGTALAWPATAALAQQDDTASTSASADQGLEEIVVTARRTAENLQRTPVSVTALSSADLERRGIDNVTDLDSQVANFSMIGGQGGGSTQSQISIRGVGQSDFILTSDQSVGLYLDGVYIARSLGAALDLVDIERIEVLRGPQGTLFGRNTTAGAVQIITARPADDLSGAIEGRFGRFGHADLLASINLPLAGGKVLTRFSVATLNQDGYGRRLFQDTDGADTNVLAARAAVRILPSDNLTIDIAVDRSRKRGHAGLERTVRIDPTDPNLAFYNAFLVSQGLPPADDRYITDSVHDTYAGARNRDDNDIFGAVGTITLDLGDLTLKSITAHRQIDAESSYDFDGTPYPLSEQLLNLRQRQFSQELQASGSLLGDRLHFVLGAFYFSEHASDLQDVPFYQPVVATGGGGFTRVPGGFSFSSFISQRTRSYAVYGQGSLRLTDRLSATLGLRYTYERKRLFSYLTGAFTRAPGTVSDSYSDVSPRFGLEFQATADAMFYASVSRGFRSGGFNGRNTTPVPPQSFEPETIWAYEVGNKLELANRRVRLNSAVFYYDYRNFQGLTLDSFNGITVTTGNIARVELYGFETELTARATRALTLGLAAGYTHQNITRVAPGAQITIRPDTRLVNSPAWTFSASADYETPIAAGVDLIVHGDFGWRSSTEFFLPNYPDETQKGYGIANARIGFRLDNPQVEIEGFVTNLTDTNYRVFAENGTALGIPVTTAIYGRPREWGVRVRYRF
jgi:iron complex outermembrane receptor protein